MITMKYICSVENTVENLPKLDFMNSTSTSTSTLTSTSTDFAYQALPDNQVQKRNQYPLQFDSCEEVYQMDLDITLCLVDDTSMVQSEYLLQMMVGFFIQDTHYYTETPPYYSLSLSYNLTCQV